jgi:hypothetical protein
MGVEYGGKVWVPVAGATAIAEEYVAARALLDEVHGQAWWNPWLLLEPSPEYEAAWEICGQWTTTEPKPPPKPLEERWAEVEQRLADADAQFLAEEAQAEKDRAERAKHYDPDRVQVRLSLLEEQGILNDAIRDRDEFLAARVAQLPAQEYRSVLLAKAEKTIAVKSKEVQDLLAVIGDPETVCDKDGSLPAERREIALLWFKTGRVSQVQALRARIADATTRLESLQSTVSPAAPPAGAENWRGCPPTSPVLGTWLRPFYSLTLGVLRGHALSLRARESVSCSPGLPRAAALDQPVAGGSP